MELIVKDVENGPYQEISLTPGADLVGVSVFRVSFNAQDCQNGSESLLTTLRETVLPRMAVTDCHYCNGGNQAVRSSVNEEAYVHTDTPVGRVVCSRNRQAEMQIAATHIAKYQRQVLDALRAANEITEAQYHRLMQERA